MDNLRNPHQVQDKFSRMPLKKITKDFKPSVHKGTNGLKLSTKVSMASQDSLNNIVKTILGDTLHGYSKDMFNFADEDCGYDPLIAKNVTFNGVQYGVAKCHWSGRKAHFYMWKNINAKHGDKEDLHFSVSLKETYVAELDIVEHQESIEPWEIKMIADQPILKTRNTIIQSSNSVAIVNGDGNYVEQS